MKQLTYKLDGHNVPIINDASFDRDAERFLNEYDRRLLLYPQPLDIEAFTEDYLGLKIHYDNLSHNGCIWGTMVFVNSKIPTYNPIAKRAEFTPIDANTVIIDNSIINGNHEEIFRSSLGHECGHSVYHRAFFEGHLNHSDIDDAYGYGIAACRRSDIVGAHTGQHLFTTAREFIEHHAKRFSAALLMPVSTMRMVCYSKGRRESAFGAARDQADAVLAEEVAEVFKVSHTSALIRIQQLRLGIEGYPDGLHHHT